MGRFLTFCIFNRYVSITYLLFPQRNRERVHGLFGEIPGNVRRNPRSAYTNSFSPWGNMVQRIAPAKTIGMPLLREFPQRNAAGM
jgi:hypothetical protein